MKEIGQDFFATMWLLQHKIAPQIDKTPQPFFLSAYFASFDESMHQHGVYSKEAAASLEKIDAQLGEMIKAAKSIAGENLLICVCSDHGSMDNTHNIAPNVLFKNAGLIELDSSGKVKSWRAFSQRAGGCAEIRLANSSDTQAYEKAYQILKELENDEQSGILEVLDNAQAKARGGFDKADFVLVAKGGYEIRDDVQGEYCHSKIYQKAQHGYSEEFEQMRASFMLHGVGISPSDGDIGEMRLIDIAPTLATFMGFMLPNAEGVSVL